MLLLRALAVSGEEMLATFDLHSPAAPTLASAEGTETIGLDVEAGAAADAETADTRAQLQTLITLAQACGENTFDETSMFNGPDSQVRRVELVCRDIACTDGDSIDARQILKEQFKAHFYNISRIMDCVGCDKCKLWGKLQITGLGTALKLLFSDAPVAASREAGTLAPTERLSLTRSEVVAFINTLHRLSESLRAVDDFRDLWNQRQIDEGTAPAPAPPAPSHPAVEEQRLPAKAAEPALARDPARNWSSALLANISDTCLDKWRTCLGLVSSYSARILDPSGTKPEL